MCVWFVYKYLRACLIPYTEQERNYNTSGNGWKSYQLGKIKTGQEPIVSKARRKRPVYWG